MDSKTVSWMRDASDEDIVEAILMTGPSKALRVASGLVGRLGPGALAQLRDAVDQTRADPVDALARVAWAGVDALSKKKRG
jgi:hypothetical protein